VAPAFLNAPDGGGPPVGGGRPFWVAGLFFGPLGWEGEKISPRGPRPSWGGESGIQTKKKTLRRPPGPPGPFNERPPAGKNPTP